MWWFLYFKNSSDRAMKNRWCLSYGARRVSFVPATFLPSLSPAFFFCFQARRSLSILWIYLMVYTEMVRDPYFLSFTWSLIFDWGRIQKLNTCFDYANQRTNLKINQKIITITGTCFCTGLLKCVSGRFPLLKIASTSFVRVSKKACVAPIHVDILFRLYSVVLYRAWSSTFPLSF